MWGESKKRNQLTNEGQIMTNDSTLCSSCYQYFHTIMSKELTKTDPVEEKGGDQIEMVIFNLNEQIKLLRDGISKNSNTGEYMHLTSCICALNAVEHLKNDEALLLTTIYQEFNVLFRKNLSLLSGSTDLSEL